MRRRDLATFAVATIAGWPLVAGGQQPGRTYRIGILTVLSISPTLLAAADEVIE